MTASASKNAAATAARNLERWVRQINDDDMPIFGRTVQEVVSVSEADESSAAQLGQVVLKDAAMTARVLKLANSAHYNPTGQHFSTISRAILMLGFDTVRNMCLTIALVDSLVQGVNREHLTREMARAFHAATQAHMVAVEGGDAIPEEVYIATLLYHIGDLAFWCFSDEEGKALDTALRRPNAKPEKAQREVLGFALTELSASLAKEWALGGLLQQSLEKGETAGERSRCVVLSHELAKASEQGWNSKEVQRLTKELAGLARQTPGDLQGKLHAGAKLAAEHSAYFGAKSVAEFIPLPAGYASDIDGGEEVAPSSPFPDPDPALQLQILREMASLAFDQTDFNMLLEMVLEGVHRGVGMDRALFALLTPDRKTLRLKYVLGDADERLQERFEFAMDTREADIFLFTMAKNHSVWLAPDSPPEMSRLVGPAITSATGIPYFFAAPVIVKGRAIVLFYADRAPSGRDLDEESYAAFQHFFQQANLLLEHMAGQ